jgi:DNA-binding HxlR family transcriptional regulator
VKIGAVAKMAMSPNVLSSKCASRRYLALIASKWSLLIINALEDGSSRNSILMHRIEGISQKMLTQNLRQLEKAGIIKREDLGTIPPHVTYELTSLGKSLRLEVRSLIVWVEANFQV